MYVRVESRRPVCPSGRAAAYSRRAGSRMRNSVLRHGVRFLIVAGVLSVGLGAAQAVTAAQLSIADMIVASANQYGVPPELALGIASHESGFNPNAVNPSGGAAGVMQILPSNFASLGITNPLDPTQNINGGMQMLSTLLKQYNGDQTLALWAYSNGGTSVTAGGSNPANMPAQAAGLVSYVESYQPPASLGLSTDDSPGPVPDVTGDTSGDSSLFDFSSLADSLASVDPSVLAVGGALLGLVLISMLHD
jgi:hypothetical protein